jgi:hypothetical protein
MTSSSWSAVTSSPICKNIGQPPTTTFVREYTLTHELNTPVSIIVHSLQDVNDQLAKGRPFFSNIARDGIMLFEAEGHPLAKAKPLSADEVKAEARGHYEQWMH